MKPLEETEHIYPTIGTEAPVLTGPYRERVVRCRDCENWSGWNMKECVEFGRRTPPDGFCHLGSVKVVPS